jgi:hypothetical protein
MVEDEGTSIYQQYIVLREQLDIAIKGDYTSLLNSIEVGKDI